MAGSGSNVATRRVLVPRTTGLERPAYIRSGATRLPASMPLQTEQTPSVVGLILVPFTPAPVRVILNQECMARCVIVAMTPAQALDLDPLRPGPAVREACLP